MPRPEPAASGFLTVAGHRVEYAWCGDGPRDEAVVLLHEGLGCIGLWRDFPGRVAAATGRAVLAWSRHGYGRSDPLLAPREPGFMHDEARIALPDLRAQLGIARPILLGHSDGASIALIHAGDGRWPVAGVIAMAPHVFVEAMCLDAIRAARIAYDSGDLRARLARHHADPDSAFRGWNDIWLDPRFPAWNIEECLPAIRCPLLLIQGEEDEYGTMAQLDRIARAVPHARRLALSPCRHSPHRDQPGAVLAAVADFCEAVPAI